MYIYNGAIAMTRLENKLIADLKAELSHLSPAAIIDHLFAHEMLCYRQMECEAIYRRFRQLRAAGRAKCRAMGDVAAHFGCSYEKVRAIIYSQIRKNSKEENGTED